MAEHDPRFNRFLAIVLLALFIISLGAFLYSNWKAEPEHNLWTTVLNALILSLPLILLYGAAHILISAWRERKQTGEISRNQAKIIFWASRIAAIVIIFFVSLFSLDVFGERGTLLEQLGAFFLHSLPSIFMIIFLVFAWRRPVIGFAGFLLAGVVFLRFVILGGSLAHFLLFSGPLLLISALFYADWRWQKPSVSAPPDTAA